jgi:hypothetical protein
MSMLRPVRGGARSMRRGKSVTKRLRISLLVWFLLVTGSSTATAQVFGVQSGSGALAEESYPVAGSHLLRREEAQLRQYLAQHPEIALEMRLPKAASWSFVVGSTNAWYADDLNALQNPRYQVASTCRAVGTHCYVFVEDASWSSGRVTQAAVDSVVATFDLRTPADPAQGIFQSNVGTFGDPPDVDGDPKIIILILDVKDGYSGSGGFVAGYFYSRNELPKSVDSQSNQAELYYIDCNPLDLRSSAGLRQGMSTTAHEFQHMIHWYHDPAEITFVDEMCSVIAEVVNGYPLYNQTYYISTTNTYLLGWGDLGAADVLKDYSRAARFGIYMHDQFGVGVFKPIVASVQNGIAGIDQGLSNYGRNERFADIFPAWQIANILDDRSYDSRYGYLYSNLPKATGLIFPGPNVTGTDTVQALASRFLSFTGGSQLEIRFNSGSPSVRIYAVEVGPATRRVLAVTPGVTFSEPEFGATYSKIHFVVMNVSTDPTGRLVYSYAANGTGGGSTVELKWDVNPPLGYLLLSAGDTVCVTFDPVQGGKLDSVRVQLNTSGSATGGVWSYPGTKLLGSPLAVPVTATNPIAAPNWVTVDLRRFGISSDSPFSVAFVDPGSSGNPHVRVSAYPSSSAYHSYTYISSGNPAGWYYLTKATDTVWVYLIRAYVSVGSSDTTVPPVPIVYKLNQNYPNPFNPGTEIGYSVAARGMVSLKVYDVLGREVAQLVSEEKEIGEYELHWVPNGLPSGAYFCRLVAGGFTETRKVMLLK